jgi:LysR family transcriptional regulator, nod-box dependent transcriptional activator
MRLGHFDLNLFVTLDALLDTQSISRAAERLHLGASATSSALGRLREHFQDELLVQVGRRMELTPLAQALRAPVRDVLLRSQATLATQSEFEPRQAQRHFQINASDYATSVLLAPLAQQLETEAPGISMDIIGLSNLAQLDRGEVDFAIYPECNAIPDHPYTALMDETYCCVVWVGHRFGPDGMSMAHYLQARHVATEFGEQRVPGFEGSFFQTQGMERNVVVTTSSFNALPTLVVGTQRIATMHTRLARLYSRILPIRLFAIPFEMPPVRLVVQWNRHVALDAAHAWMRQRLLAAATEVMESDSATPGTFAGQWHAAPPALQRPASPIAQVLGVSPVEGARCL